MDGKRGEGGRGSGGGGGGVVYGGGGFGDRRLRGAFGCVLREQRGVESSRVGAVGFG